MKDLLFIIQHCHGFGNDGIDRRPAVVGPAVFLNQFIFTAILSPILIKLLYTYVIRAGLFRGKNVK